MTWFVELMHRDGSVQTRRRVDAGEMRIGRALDNDLIIDDPYCAAHHALLRIESDGSAVLQDLGTRNGTAPARAKGNGHASVFTVQNDSPYRAGQSLIRIRNSAWPLPPELAMSSRLIWPFALAALLVVLLHTAWQIWLRDVGEKSPPYVYGLVGVAAGVAVWSGVYALLGRLISGAERFFTHLLIASCGYLAISLAERILSLVSFSMAWLWPARIEYSVIIILIALLVRAHLRLADPRHWPTLRWAVSLVAAMALIVPVAQLWLSSQRLTNVQTLSNSEHPALRLAQPVDIEALVESTAPLKIRVDALRSKEDTDSADEDEQ